MQVLMGFALQRRLSGTNITVSSVHPGYVCEVVDSRFGLIEAAIRLEKDKTSYYTNKLMCGCGKNWFGRPSDISQGREEECEPKGSQL